MTIKTEFDFGQYVYVTTDTAQQHRIITGITIRDKSVIYELACGVEVSSHYGVELTVDENTLIKVK